jgi:hypothetical protein
VTGPGLHLRLLAVVTLLLAPVLSLPTLAVPTAHAQIGDDLDVDIPTVRLVVSDLVGIVGPGSLPPPDPDDENPPTAPTDLDLRLLVENTSTESLRNLQVVVEVHPSFGGARSLAHQALDQQVVRGALRALWRTDLRDGGAIGPGDVAGVAVTIPGNEIGWSGTNDIYPVQVSVLLGSRVLERVVLGVVHLVDQADRPLQTTVVWPLVARSDRTAAGTYRHAIPPELEPGGHLDRMLRAVERHASQPILLAPDAVLIEELADRAAGFVLEDGTTVDPDDPPARHAAELLERIRVLVENSPLDPVVGPYGLADISALVTAPQPVTPLADRSLDLARTRTQALLGRAPDLQVHAATTPVTTEVLGTLGTDHVLLPWDQIVGPDLSTLPDLPLANRRLVEVVGQRAPQTATVADPHVAAVLTSPPRHAGEAVAAQRLIAETASLYLLEPGRAGRTLLVMPPPDWSPIGQTASTFLDALVESPWLTLGPPLEGGTEPVVLQSGATAVPPMLVDQIAATLRRMDALRVAMPDGVPGLEGQSIGDLADAMLRVLTPDALAGQATAAEAGIQEVQSIVHAAFGEVRLAAGARVTLTSETGEIPITLERPTGDDIDVIIEVESSTALRWDDDRRQHIRLLAGSSRTVSFSTHALSRGTFPVTVSVWDPTREVLLDSTILSVRSTAISRTALLIIAGVVVVLLLIGEVRRRRQPRLEVVP